MRRDKRNSSGSGEDGKVEADRTCFYFRRHELSSDAPKTIRDVPVDRLSNTYFLTRPPPPLSPHSDFRNCKLGLRMKTVIRSTSLRKAPNVL